VGALLGFAATDSLAPLVNRVRLLAVAAAFLTTAWTLTQIPMNPKFWLIALVIGVVGIYAIPDHWDSARMVARVLSGLCLAGAVLSFTTATWRYGLISAFVLYHFGNMFVATTSPDPTPWVSNQAMIRVYMPYMRFMYLGNAYHFYSPEPGPSSLLFCLMTWEIDEPETNPDGTTKLKPDGTPQLKTESGWVNLPQRDQHYRDPLGLAYYRRLSITELVSVSVPSNLTLATFEKNEAFLRRQAVAVRLDNPIPLTAEVDPIELQYRIPRVDIHRYLYPSYARHIAAEYSTPQRRVVSMKLYRVEHRVVGMQAFLTKDENGVAASPFNPLSFRPYFVGDFDPEGNLKNPQDPMLYWLTPIVANPNGGSPLDRQRPGYIDYMSKHAGFQFDWRDRP
jgi:hypothetical protein